MTKNAEGRVVKFFKESTRFMSKRQASKYLNQMGHVWKAEHSIPLTDPKRKIP